MIDREREAKMQREKDLGMQRERKHEQIEKFQEERGLTTHTG